MEDLCLTLHQPWASLVVWGIKRIEGRNWTTKHRGRLWIHAASKTPEDVEAVEGLYRQIYAAEGIADLKFPEHYPTSALLGCVDIIGCLSREELSQVTTLPDSVKLELMSEHGFLCENAKLLKTPLRMRGWQGIFHLGPQIAERATSNLQPSPGPKPIRFATHLANAQDRTNQRAVDHPGKWKSEGKENEQMGKAKSQGFAGWEAKVNPHVLAAKAALTASMKSKRHRKQSKLRETGWRESEPSQNEVSAETSQDGSEVRVEKQKRRGRAGQKQGGENVTGKKGLRERSKKNEERPVQTQLELDGGILEVFEEERGMIGSVEEGRLGQMSEKDEAGTSAEFETVVETGWGDEAKPGAQGPEVAEPNNEMQLEGKSQQLKYFWKSLDGEAWPQLGADNEVKSTAEGFQSPSCRKRRGEALTGISSGVTPWLERVKLGKGPKIENEAPAGSEAFLPRQLRSSRA